MATSFAVVSGHVDDGAEQQRELRPRTDCDELPGTVRRPCREHEDVLGDVDHSFGKPAQRASGTPAVSESDLHVMILGLAYIGMLF